MTATTATTKRTVSLDKPGTYQAMSQVAEGTWKVIYAPHMTTISNAFGGTFDVSYTLNVNLDLDRNNDGDKDNSNDNDDKVIGGITSHAKYNFPIVGRTGYLSVAGTWGSESDSNSARTAGRRDVCRIDFNQAWVKPLMKSSEDHDMIQGVGIAFRIRIEKKTGTVWNIGRGAEWYRKKYH